MVEVSQEHTVAVVFHKLMYHCDLICLLFCILAELSPVILYNVQYKFYFYSTASLTCSPFPIQGDIKRTAEQRRKLLVLLSKDALDVILQASVCVKMHICLLKYTVKIYRLSVECFQGWGCSSVFGTLAAQAKVPGFDLQQLFTFFSFASRPVISCENKDKVDVIN